jgi:hypothetical protein
MLCRAGKKGIRVMRSGGALGRCEPSDPDFQEFLDQLGIVPRLKRGCHFLIVNSDRGHCGFYAMYITPYACKRRCIPFWYNTPRKGGHQMLLDEQMAAHSVLHKFPECRRDAAMLLVQRNKWHLKIGESAASSDAANNMMDQW